MIRLFLLLMVLALCSWLPAIAEDPESHARRLINALGCKACHSFEQSGSTLAPSLDRIGKRLTAQQLMEKLIAPRDENKKEFMPSYATTPQKDLDAIVQFLVARK